VDYNKQLEELQVKVAEVQASVRAAATENHNQIQQRIDEAKVTMTKEANAAKAGAGQTASEARNQWAQVKADAATRVAKAKHDIDRRGDEFDADMAASDASSAEDDAAGAIDFAEWAVENARVAILDAIDARVYAKQKEAAIRV